MRNRNSPYRFDAFEDADLDEAPEPDPTAVDLETVIVEGASMSYRSYRRQR
ncbi:hypothetical protein [Halomarina ordinaria]|uniref:Uncharacterized protein n=1 Tax=Halomarina ordinaria TaxID=3033939 RepID=A0ABD5U5B6_9EURY|nr:hypothetical protein [Halomarina sp. PSRA2]